MSRGKVSNEQRLAAAKACAEGKMSLSEAARRLGVCWTNVREWTARYREEGASAFLETDGNLKYNPEIKLRAVKEYLDGKGSLKEVAAKYGLHTKSTLLGWIKVYNSGGDFRRRGSGGSRMTTGRKTTQEASFILFTASSGITPVDSSSFRQLSISSHVMEPSLPLALDLSASMRMNRARIEDGSKPVSLFPSPGIVLCRPLCSRIAAVNAPFAWADARMTVPSGRSHWDA